MSPQDKPLVWMHGEIATPPFSENARIIDICKQRINRFEADIREGGK
ncbi:hypothetical protein D1AOALGA4SA_4802 [Olavius algarvensis Delta 1 endosymbiont]|nr:hypothetical protein D1AOALGA4SA_4802 [Olavius algarvensis Delta 1 endosymbiont]